MANKKQSSLETEADYSTNLNDYQFNSMKLDPELIAELKGKNLAWRFINKHDLKRNGYHKSYWSPYQRDRKPSDAQSVASRIYGEDPDGFVIRGDSILATKPREQAEQYRTLLQHRNAVLAKQVSPASQLKKLGESIDHKTMKFSEVGDDE